MSFGPDFSRTIVEPFDEMMEKMLEKEAHGEKFLMCINHFSSFNIDVDAFTQLSQVRIIIYTVAANCIAHFICATATSG